ncbi:uncharacterized protein L201_007523 [Kwoniella dendrophila CBS 6074]|uniref:NADH:flavin oxidoreductase/NADH oxidase N-terminal domain-containing protein n=1 Tax=Kwoniella dendrophila CBS 6074 TaxID=1295534 RepID=A0AAX4K588_9TREE
MTVINATSSTLRQAVRNKALSSGNLFKPYQLGNLSLKHRIVMAPMTRLRAGEKDGIPSEWAIDYYSSRATDGGLIITEAVSPSLKSRVWNYIPCIESEDQIKRWKEITEAVHAKGGKIIIQLAQAG